MPESPLIAAGAQVEPIPAAALHTNRFFTGLWTQRSPLRDAATPYLYQTFYQATRYDSMLGGQNVEISPRLTLVRRYGNTLYNTNTFPPINRFYEFRTVTTAGEQIHVMASCDPATGFNYGTLRDVTGPSTNLVLLDKAVGAGRTSFIGVGNTLYFGDGTETKKWVTSAYSWSANWTVPSGTVIVDSNNNLQQAYGPEEAAIVGVAVFHTPITAHPAAQTAYIFLAPGTEFGLTGNAQVNLTLAGMTARPLLNGTWPCSVYTPNQLVIFDSAGGLGTPTSGDISETGTASAGTSVTGATQPAWQTGIGEVTGDGTAQWICKGPSVQNWGFAAPNSAPTVTQVAAAGLYPSWTTNTWYAPLFVIVDSNGNLQQLTSAGTTGSSAPAWNATTGGTTADGSAVWTNKGSGAWAAGTVYAANALIQATFSYFTTTQQYQFAGFDDEGDPVYQSVPVTSQVTATCLFQCTTGGTSGSGQPSWNNGLGTLTTDNTVVWTNLGNAQAWPGATQALSLATKIIDSNGNVQAVQNLGKSGATAPATWSATLGSFTIDNTLEWLNTGPYSAANSYAWQWAYSGQNSITGQIGTASPVSQSLVVGANKSAVVQGFGFADEQIDTIVLWRTAQGGSLLLFDDSFSNPGAGQPWIYTDTNPDTSLNELIEAPISSTNNPPPSDFTPQAYHEGRIWGFSQGTKLVYSNGPDSVVGNGNESFDPENIFNLPSSGVGCWSTTLGLIVMRVDGITVILGNGTSTAEFYAVDIYDSLGLAGQDAFDTQGNSIFLMTTTAKVMRLTTAQFLSAIEDQVSQGLPDAEVGFPIGDVLAASFTPADSYVTWHEGPSEDSGLFVADGANYWFNMKEIKTPEQCTPWSPEAYIAAGIKAVKSLDIAPGVRRLLMGPSQQGGYILYRDTTTNTDNGTPFTGYADFGNVVLANPGTNVAVQFIGADVLDIGSLPSIGLLFDEIEGDFMNLKNSTSDPVNLPESETIPGRRWFVMQGGSSSVKCRHIQIRFSWPAEDFANELETYTIYGRLPEKARK